jgi:hypothetical protein
VKGCRRPVLPAGAGVRRAPGGHRHPPAPPAPPAPAGRSVVESSGAPRHGAVRFPGVRGVLAASGGADCPGCGRAVLLVVRCRVVAWCVVRPARCPARRAPPRPGPAPGGVGVLSGPGAARWCWMLSGGGGPAGCAAGCRPAVRRAGSARGVSACRGGRAPGRWVSGVVVPGGRVRSVRCCRRLRRCAYGVRLFCLRPAVRLSSARCPVSGGGVFLPGGCRGGAVCRCVRPFLLFPAGRRVWRVWGFPLVFSVR